MDGWQPLSYLAYLTVEYAAPVSAVLLLAAVALVCIYAAYYAAGWHRY